MVTCNVVCFLQLVKVTHIVTSWSLDRFYGNRSKHTKHCQQLSNKQQILPCRMSKLKII